MLGFLVFLHQLVYKHYLDFGYEIKMISFPFADLSETGMLHIFETNCSNEPSALHLETNNDILLNIDHDLHAYSNTIKKQCNNYDSNICSSNKNVIDYILLFRNLNMPFTFMGNIGNIRMITNLPTREKKESSTLLDKIYTNIPDCYNNCT